MEIFADCPLTTSQAELNGKRIAHPQGKGLGGSSLINLLGLIFPSKAGYDVWSAMGNEGWDWESMSPYLRKFHTWNPPSNEKVEQDLRLNIIVRNDQGNLGTRTSVIPSRSQFDAQSLA